MKSDIDIHDRVADAYYGNLGKAFMRKTQKRIHWVASNVNSGEILDVGCSQGITSILLARDGNIVTAIDPSQDSIDDSNRYLEKEEEDVFDRINFKKSDFISIYIEDESFDTVIIAEVLEHLTGIEPFIKKSFAVLRDSGKLIVTVPFGINDHFDHKKTFYFYELYKALSKYFVVDSYEIMGKWIGFVAIKKSKSAVDESIIITEDIIQDIENSFYNIERLLIDELATKKERLILEIDKKKGLEVKLSTSNEELSGLNNIISQSNSDLEKEKNLVSVANERLAIIETDKKDLRQELSILRDKERLLSDKNINLSIRVDNYINQNKKYKDNIASLKEASDRQTGELSGLNNIISQSNSDLEKEKNLVSVANERLAIIETDKKDLRQELSILNNIISQSNSDLEKEKNLVSVANERLAIIETDKKDLRQELSILRDKERLLSDKNKNLSIRVDDYINQNKKYKDNIAILKEASDRQIKKNTKLSIRINNYINQNKKYKDRLLQSQANMVGKNSLSYLMGYQLVHAFSSWYSIFLLPLNLLKARISYFELKNTAFSAIPTLDQKSGIDVGLINDEPSARKLIKKAKKNRGDVQLATRLGSDALNMTKDPKKIDFLSKFFLSVGSHSQSRLSVEKLKRIGITPDDTLVGKLECLDYLTSLSNASVPKSKIVPGDGSIFYFASSILPCQISGYTTRTHSLTSAIKKAGYNISVFSRPGYPNDRIDLESVSSQKMILEDMDYNIIQAEGRSNDNLCLQFTESVNKIKSILDKNKPSVVHVASNFENALPAIIAAREIGIPTIYEVRGFWEYTAASKKEAWDTTDQFFFEKRMEAIACELSDYVFTLTSGMVDEIKERTNGSVTPALLPNAIDEKAMLLNSTTKTGIHKYDQNFVIGYIGSILKYEGLDDLISILPVLKSEIHNVKIVIVGDGDTKKSLESLANELGVSDYVDFVGSVPSDEVDKYFKTMDLICLPRKPYKVCELVSPLKPLEAMIHGIPVVASSVKALADMIVNKETGYIFTSGNRDSLAGVLISAHNNQKQRLEISQKAKDFVLNKRTWDYVTRPLLDIYDNIIKENK